ncbi:hypothetical protein GCM10010919_14330 [Alishewanella longhuensis]|uniref:Uncharacterized protein n=1 Tax=Alishewanella longhuensis TaxID=1091037 RepID=A0ABQ3KY09_9ALTE|nr:hypothetical protein [Alishewanella longhuensis]GHG66549.1 hypothetical protein GCM10010919_14330 [Alishewanella longhuensis]
MNFRASTLVTALLASASCFAADTYQVSESVYSQGKLVASPTIVVEADKMASITMGNNFSYNLTVKPNQDETAGVVAAVTVGDSTINPSFTVAYGKEATIEIGSQKLTLLVSKVGS